MALLVIYLLFLVREQRLAALSVIVMGMGVWLAGYFPHFNGLMLTTLLMSFGFHYFETLNMSLALQHFDKTTAPQVMGRLRSLASIANLVVGGLVFLVAGVLDYTSMFAMIGVVTVAAGAWCLCYDPRPKETVPQAKHMLMRKKYSLFYVLTLLAGARRQIFVAFAVFLMVERFGFTVREITLLFVANNLINAYVSPILGKAIVKYGERRVLSLEYFSLIWIFIAYAATDSKAVVAGLYILDHLFFNFHIALRTYFQKIGDPAHIAPTMAVGFTINHVAAVFIPAFGGMLWMVDYRIPFLMAAGLSLLSLTLTQFIRVPAPAEAQ